MNSMITCHWKHQLSDCSPANCTGTQAHFWGQVSSPAAQSAATDSLAVGQFGRSSGRCSWREHGGPGFPNRQRGHMSCRTKSAQNNSTWHPLSTSRQEGWHHCLRVHPWTQHMNNNNIPPGGGSGVVAHLATAIIVRRFW